MKIFKQEIAPSGKPRVLFACNDEDIQLLKGIVDQAMLTFPRYPEHLKESYQRLHGIARGFNEYLAGEKIKARIKKAKSVPCPYCERHLRDEKGLQQHMVKNHSERNHE